MAKGTQKKPQEADDFYRVDEVEPHLSRRREILKVHPEIEKLYGPDINQAYTIVGVVLLQFACIYLVRDASWWVVLLVAWVVGGTANHNLELANHELSHSLVFKTQSYNVALGIVTNLPTGFPSAITFKRYHLEHHLFQGVWGRDADLASEWEGRFFTTPFRKFFYVLFLGLIYALRPTMLMPKKVVPMEIVNWIVQLAFDYAVWTYLGPKSFIYIFASTVLGLGLHPMAGHFLSEHYMVEQGQETYSYYGPLNIFAYNVGYHNEHHDFPRVPGSRLPQVRALAPEFYNMPETPSWPGILFWFITNSAATPFRRVIRAPEVLEKSRSKPAAPVEGADTAVDPPQSKGKKSQ